MGVGENAYIYQMYDLIERYVTLLPENERFYKKTFTHYFNNCIIEGTVDFIFGGSNATFKDCTIISLPCKNNTYIVAPNHKSDVTQGFVFDNCKIIKDSNTKDKSVYLARPWRDYGFVTFNNCYLDSHIKEEGFSVYLTRNNDSLLAPLNSTSNKFPCFSLNFSVLKS